MKEKQWLASLVGIILFTGLAAAPAAPPGPGFTMGTVVAWGSNTNGECNVPADLTNAVAIAAGIEHSVALRADGTVEAWGADEYHQTDIPPGLSNVVAISSRGYHTLVLKSDGTVAAWGLNNTWQLEIPPDATNVVAIAAGGNHNMVLKADGTVEVWGWGVYGETNVPPDLNNVVAISAGSHHCVAQKSDGSIVVWGYPGYDVSVPDGLSDVAVVKAGRFYNLALKNDGSVVAWGENNDGQTNVPPDWTNIVQIAAGGFHNLALRADGKVLGFGLNDNGQASPPATLHNVLALSAGTTHSLALVAGTYSYDPSGTVVSTTITSPTPGITWSNDTMTVQGTATSIHGLFAVFYQLNDSAWQLANTTDGFADWSAEVSLSAPDNVLRAYAVDTAGVVSTTNEVNFSYQAQGTNTLRVFVNGNGKIDPNWVGDRNLKLGKAYRLKAIPAPGWIFYQWTGSTNSMDPLLRFVMAPGLTFTANFVPNPYPALQGSFTGLFFGDTNDPQFDPSSCGALTVQMTKDGSFSGRVSSLSGSASISGNAHLDASDTNLLVLPITSMGGRTGAVSGTLQLDLTDPSQSVFGTLQLTSGRGSAAQTSTAMFQGQMLRTGKGNPDIGTYNFNLDPEAPYDGPVGGSFGRVTIRSSNSATVQLSLADQNATATVGSSETVGGLVPFFAPLYGHKGLVSGWLQLSQGTVLSSNVLWFKPANASKAYYPQGFIQTLGGSGTLFTPAHKSSLLPSSAGTVDLEDGASVSTTADFTVNKGRCVVPKDQNTNAIAFSFSSNSGLLNGNFQPAGQHRRLPMKGILISTNSSAPPFATGYFLEPNQSGKVGVSFQ